MNANRRLVIRNFAQIREVSIEFGDLTVLVGAQGTGKSLALQWLKVANDGKEIIKALGEAGLRASTDQDFVDLVFGAGMGQAWCGDSEVFYSDTRITPTYLMRKRGSTTRKVFYIPAHRSMLVSDGWAAPFQKLSSDTPVVARLFSQTLFDLFSAKAGSARFPLERKLKRPLRDLIDRSVFHGGEIALEEDLQHRKRLRMKYGTTHLPFMTWTAGQREFTPLLFGLYHLLPSSKVTKRKDEWVVIEEPEMGLHPEAINAVLALVLDLLSRGYRVVLSSHSPHVLTAVWMLQRLKERHAHWQLLCEAFDLPTNSKPIQDMSEAAMKKSYKVFFFEFGDDRQVTSRDISGLDPGSENIGEADWGGLTGYSSRFGQAVRKAVNEAD